MVLSRSSLIDKLVPELIEISRSEVEDLNYVVILVREVSDGFFCAARVVGFARNWKVHGVATRVRSTDGAGLQSVDIFYVNFIVNHKYVTQRVYPLIPRVQTCC